MITRLPALAGMAGIEPARAESKSHLLDTLYCLIIDFDLLCRRPQAMVLLDFLLFYTLKCLYVNDKQKQTSVYGFFPFGGCLVDTRYKIINILDSYHWHPYDYIEDYQLKTMA